MFFLKRWEEEPVPFRRLPEYMLGGAQVMFLASASGEFVLYILGLELSSENVGNFAGPFPGVSLNILAGAFIEELIFRVPLFIQILFHCSFLVLPLVVVLSSVFGFMHGDFTNIAVQGLSGIILSLIFLRCGALEGSFFKAIIASTGTHAIFNAMLVAFGSIASLFL